MSRIHTPPVESATGAAAEIYAQIKKASGSVPNTFASIGAHGPAALKAILQADGVLASGSLSKQDQQTIKLLVSAEAGCDYCVAAYTMLGELSGLKPDVLRQIRKKELTDDDKRNALIHFVRDLVTTSGISSQAEFDAIKEAGYTDEQLVDISLAITVASFTNVFNRINDTAVDFPSVD
ncbi:putative peroxidase-related enzyme [Luteibacter sp. OK325]|uniref:carboxymuconolactone decarboxylase family protein n=1 Tax=Luteibacter sp. OK325 TaxID=2135670 RepID=UPI000D3BEF71|nr:carboxymuconolactone decarboxylase family protein [Luteibacter sp. OK325]PTR34087.1 putative peroxidase-related enzyme [Luteibacter sp. OK325]